VTTDEIFEKYPEIFRGHNSSPMESPMFWGLDCGPGWYPLIDEMCLTLEKLRECTGVGVIADQVKEKWGELCFYYTCEVSDDADENRVDFWKENVCLIVSMYTIRSSGICEKCGNPGTKGGRSWLKTLCEQCRSSSENRSISNKILESMTAVEKHEFMHEIVRYLVLTVKNTVTEPCGTSRLEAETYLSWLMNDARTRFGEDRWEWLISIVLNHKDDQKEKPEMTYPRSVCLGKYAKKEK